MSKSAGGSRETQNSQSGVDQTTQQRMQAMWDAAQAAGQAGPSPLVTGAADYNTNAMKAGGLGLNALSGDAGATASLMNPYQQQVIGGANAEYDLAGQHAMNAVDQRATMAHAFGGSRHGVAEGVALADNNRARTNGVNGLLYGGFNDAMNRAGTLANGGFQAGNANANLGLGGVGSPQQWMLQMLKQGYQGPTGMTSSGAKAKVETSAEFNPAKLLGALFGGG